jgi:hypothetical protein
VRDDGADFHFQYSVDGYNFEDVFTQGRTAWLPSGGNQWGFGIFSNPTANARCLWDSFEVI